MKNERVVSIGSFPVALVSGLILAFSAVAWSHVPIFEDKDIKGFDDALAVNRVDGSHAIYAKLDTPEDVDFFSVEVKEPMRFYANIIVPLSEGYEDYYPVFAVLGPGLPSPGPGLPFEPPEGYGAVLVQAEPGAGDERPVFHEHFSNTFYYRGIPSFDREVTHAGTYYIVVWHTRCEPGSYVVSYGRGEKWSLKDMKGLFSQMKVIKSGLWIIDRAGIGSDFACER